AAHLRRQVEGHREPRLPLLEQVVVPLVRLVRGAEARVLAHGPKPPAVHVRLHAPREGRLTGKAEIADGIEADRLEIVGPVEVLRIEAAGVETGVRTLLLHLRGGRLLPALTTF